MIFNDDAIHFKSLALTFPKAILPARDVDNMSMSGYS